MANGDTLEELTARSLACDGIEYRHATPQMRTVRDKFLVKGVNLINVLVLDRIEQE